MRMSDEPRGFPTWAYELPEEFWLDEEVLSFINEWRAKKAHQWYKNLQTRRRIKDGK